MKIFAEKTDGNEVEITNINEFCLTQSLGVPCDSLWIKFFDENDIGEISKIKLYDKGNLIFNGLCDCQKSSESKSGYEISIFARSTACILVDNETVPYTYEKPSAKQLCRCIAEKFGFFCALPEIYSDMAYEVTAGSSCYGAISRFVSLLTGSYIYVTPNNEIKAVELSGNVKSINIYDVLTAVHTIDRSEPISKIRFKKSSGEPRYNMNTEARLGSELGIKRETYINLSALPQWQRDNTVLKRLKASYENYDTLEITVSGYADESLMQCFSYETKRKRYENYYLAEKKYMCSEKGEFTKLTLRKNIDIQEITYVDK